MAMKDAIKARASGDMSGMDANPPAPTDANPQDAAATGGGDETQKQVVSILQQIASAVQDIFVTKKDVANSVQKLSEELNNLIQLAISVSETETQPAEEGQPPAAGGVSPEGVPGAGKSIAGGQAM